MYAVSRERRRFSFSLFLSYTHSQCQIDFRHSRCKNPVVNMTHAAYDWSMPFRCCLGNCLYCLIRTATSCWSRKNGSSFSRGGWRKYLFLLSMDIRIVVYFVIFRRRSRYICLASRYLRLFRNEKQNDFVDQIESVAYVLCGENPISLNNFRQIFHTKGVRERERCITFVSRENVHAKNVINPLRK